MPKDSDNKIIFINNSKSLKILSSLLELKSFIFTLLLKVLDNFILILLLDGHLQMVKSRKMSFSFFLLDNFIFALAIDVLKDFILILLLKAINSDKIDGKV